jgi:hypothetical protein
MAHIRFNRCSETQFRTNVPISINGIEVLEVIGYQSGGSGVYASAYALTQPQPGEFATHAVICVDDNPVGTLNWSLSIGHYDFRTREDAFADLVARSFHETLTVQAV